MDTRIALIGIILESRESVDELNHLLSEYGEYVIGRMGIPYREKGIHVISVAMDAPNNVISALSGKLGMLPGVSTKTIYGKIYEGRRMTPNEREQRVISLIDRLCLTRTLKRDEWITVIRERTPGAAEHLLNWRGMSAISITDTMSTSAD